MSRIVRIFRATLPDTTTRDQRATAARFYTHAVAVRDDMGFWHVGRWSTSESAAIQAVSEVKNKVAHAVEARVIPVECYWTDPALAT